MHRPVEETEMKLCEVKIYGGNKLNHKRILQLLLDIYCD